jgi:hypothetical protein
MCLLPGSPVFVKDGGVKEIECLSEQDEVLVNDGNYQKVIKPLRRSYSGELVSVRTTGLGIGVMMTPAHRVYAIRRRAKERKEYFRNKQIVYSEAIKMRNNEGIGSSVISKRLGVHPQTIEQWFRGSKPHDGHSGFLQSLSEFVQSNEGKPEWIPVRDLEKGDIVLFPVQKGFKEIESVPLPQNNFNATRRLPSELKLTSTVLEFLGFYVSEGCGTNESVIFCFHKEERSFVSLVVSIIKSLGLHCKVSPHRVKKSVTVRIDSVLLSKFLTECLGKGAHNKVIPSWINQMPEWQIVPFLRGVWLGDGSKWALLRGKRFTSYSTVSKVLAYQLFQILIRLGYLPRLVSEKVGYSISINGNQVIRFVEEVLKSKIKLKRGKEGGRTFLDDDFYYMPITEIGKIAYTGDVFNLEVESNHCYCSPFIVHNSEGFGIEVLEAMSCGREAIASTGCGASDISSWQFDAGRVDHLMNLIENCRQHANVFEPPREMAVKYSWDKIRERYIKVWKELLQC